MVKLFSKNSNLCDHNSPTSQTDRRADRQTTCDRNTALCTKVHRAVKLLGPYEPTLINVTLSLHNLTHPPRGILYALLSVNMKLNEALETIFAVILQFLRRAVIKETHRAGLLTAKRVDSANIFVVFRPITILTHAHA